MAVFNAPVQSSGLAFVRSPGLVKSRTENDMPLDSATYDATRDVIWAVRGGYLFKCSAKSGRKIQSKRLLCPGQSPTCITYAPNVDRLFMTMWNDPVHGGYRGRDDINYPPNTVLAKINPGSMEIVDVFNFDNPHANFAEGTGFPGGPVYCEYSMGYIFVQYRWAPDFDAQEVLRFSPSGNFTNPITANPGFSFQYNSENRSDIQLAFNPAFNQVFAVDGGDIMCMEALDYPMTIRYRTQDVSNVTIPGVGNTEPVGLTYNPSDHYLYLTTGTQYLWAVETRAGGNGVTVNLSRPNANPRRIRYRPANGHIYIPCWRDNTVLLIAPNTHAIEVKLGFDSPYDIVFADGNQAGEAFAVQHGEQGLKRIP